MRTLQIDGPDFLSFAGEIQISEDVRIPGFKAGGLSIKVRLLRFVPIPPPNTRPRRIQSCSRWSRPTSASRRLTSCGASCPCGSRRTRGRTTTAAVPRRRSTRCPRARRRRMARTPHSRATSTRNSILLPWFVAAVQGLDSETPCAQTVQSCVGWVWL